MAEALASNCLSDQESPTKDDACPEQQPDEDGDSGSSTGTGSDYSDFEGMKDVWFVCLCIGLLVGSQVVFNHYSCMPHRC